MRPDVTEAILEMYRLIDQAAERQALHGHADRGNRRGITSGRHLDPLADLIRADLIRAGFRENDIYQGGYSCVLPGWFRPTKNWDLLAFDGDDLIGAIELKSISNSFGNNANNRAEESIGSAIDAIEAFNEGLYGGRPMPPAMGYVMIVRDCPDSRRIGPGVGSRHFPIDPVFHRVSYLDRFRILCERLRSKSLYQAVWLVFADPDTGTVEEPSQELTYEKFITTIQMALRIHQA